MKNSGSSRPVRESGLARDVDVLVVCGGRHVSARLLGPVATTVAHRHAVICRSCRPVRPDSAWMWVPSSPMRRGDAKFSDRS
jgi:hypothetical protein